MSEAHELTLLLGNPRRGSRTRGVALRATAALLEGLAAHGVPLAGPAVIDLAEWVPTLFALDPAQRRVDVHEAFRAVPTATLLVVASPTFKGSYTGLLKLFLDQLPRAALRGVVAVPLMTAANIADQHAVESYLRPLLVALGAVVPAAGLSVLESRFDALEDVLAPWCAATAPVLAAALARPALAAPLTRIGGAPVG